MKKKAIYQAYVIGILSILFLGLLIYSTTQESITAEYNIQDTIDINSLKDATDGMKIGTAKISNTALIPKRTKLKKLVICEFSSTTPTYLEIEYLGSKTINNKLNSFSYNYYSRSIDLESNQEITLDIITTRRSYYIENLIKEHELYNKQLTLYIFEMQENDYAYNYCRTVSQENAIDTITVNFNIDPQIEKNPTYKY